MVKEYVGEAKALLEELKPEAGAPAVDAKISHLLVRRLTRRDFLRALMKGFLTVGATVVSLTMPGTGEAAVNDPTPTSHCLYKRCTQWRCWGTPVCCVRRCQWCDVCANSCGGEFDEYSPGCFGHASTGA